MPSLPLLQVKDILPELITPPAAFCAATQGRWSLSDEATESVMIVPDAVCIGEIATKIYPLGQIILLKTKKLGLYWFE